MVGVVVYGLGGKSLTGYKPGNKKNWGQNIKHRFSIFTPSSTVDYSQFHQNIFKIILLSKF